MMSDSSQEYQIINIEQGDFHQEDILFWTPTCLNQEADIGSQSWILTERAEPSTQNDISAVEEFINCPQPSQVRETASRVTIFREKKKAEMSSLEKAMESLNQQIVTAEQRVAMKHSNLAGQCGKPFYQKIYEFSRQSLKTELHSEISKLNEELTEGTHRKMRNQRRAAFITQLKALQEKKNKYLSLLLEEEQE